MNRSLSRTGKPRSPWCGAPVTRMWVRACYTAPSAGSIWCCAFRTGMTSWMATGKRRSLTTLRVRRLGVESGRLLRSLTPPLRASGMSFHPPPPHFREGTLVFRCLALPLFCAHRYPPMIENEKYVGPWSPRKIPNPDYWEDNSPYKFTPIGALSFEIWTMSAGPWLGAVLKCRVAPLS
jgi:calreticulin family protein